MTLKKVLIVDDEPDIREVAALCFELAGGYRILSARSGLEALEVARAEAPDAILMDIMMPEMDGLTAVRHLQADEATARIPVVLLTAKALSDEMSDVASLGVHGIIAKPFDPMKLAASLEAALGWKR
ncbi:response regulator [bacterium]|nr:response regulator [bacterium]